MKNYLKASVFLTSLFVINNLFAVEDFQVALKRAQYLLNGTIPYNDDLIFVDSSFNNYKDKVRSMLDNEKFYNAILRYHEKLFGTGLPTEYIDELLQDDIDNKKNKFAQITCKRETKNNKRFRCYWSSSSRKKVKNCPLFQEEPVVPFWYPGLVAWVCPSIKKTCGANLSGCFIDHKNDSEAKNAELGKSEIFDSRYAVIKSLSKQPAGLAAAVVVADYPYTKILESGLTAIDGAIAHFYSQKHHFDLGKIRVPGEVLELTNGINLTHTNFQLVKTSNLSDYAGVLTTFAWLRRYEKNRTRANKLYEKLLCKTFTSELPQVFPADPGNLRTTDGCKGCHASLDPLSDFFHKWGEGGELYSDNYDQISTTFAGKTGSSLLDLANIITDDSAFSQCSVQNVFKWLMGRDFHQDEEDLRNVLSKYFVTTGYSLKELVFAIATHSVFTSPKRENAIVDVPLLEPALGSVPSTSNETDCSNIEIDFGNDIEPSLTLCTNCHNSSATQRVNLENESDWTGAKGVANLLLMTSGAMPPGQAGPPVAGSVFEFKEKVRCWLKE